MMQDLKFMFYEMLFRYASNDILMLIAFLFAVLLFTSAASGVREKTKALVIVSLTALAAFFGARVLHVLIEKPSLLDSSAEIFSRYDGMTFNGSILFGLIVFKTSLYLFAQDKRGDSWDLAALVTSFSYGLLRIGCFSTGCCWGQISATTWSVKYYHSTVMPWHGIPVHPVQLYDAILGFSIFFILLYLRSQKPRTRHLHFPIFMAAYAVGRFVTEFFRGDSIRGENLLFGFSTSQWVSVVLLFGALLWILRNRQLQRVGMISALLLLSACVPKAPKDKDFKSVQRTEQYEVYTNNKNKLAQPAVTKNVLFLAGDDNIQLGFASSIEQVYPTQNAPRLEDIAFWAYLKDLKNIYGTIVRIPYEKITAKNLMAAIQHLENLKQPYDLILLTHGLPNHLSTGQGYFFSFRELASLKGKLTHLNLVMMQSCFGSSLSKDWIEAGAQHVISFPDLNRNFFFIGDFLKWYYPGKTVEAAYFQTQQNIAFDLTTGIYPMVIRFLFQKPNQEPIRDEELNLYIQNLPMPEILSKKKS